MCENDKLSTESTQEQDACVIQSIFSSQISIDEINVIPLENVVRQSSKTVSKFCNVVFDMNAFEDMLNTHFTN